LILIPAGTIAFAAGNDTLGTAFARKSYTPEPLPVWAETRHLLPSPIDEAHPDRVAVYWKAWELAFRNFHVPAPGTGFVSNFIDAAFNANIFLWDTAFMTMFCNLAHPLVPGISSLDNFYCKQHASGEICREINRSTGRDFAPWVNSERRPLFSRWGFKDYSAAGPTSIVYRDREAPDPPPALTLDALDNPIPAWAEMESYRVTGDTARLRLVFPPLAEYYRALRTYLRQGNGLYVTDWASMDNSPRNPFLRGGGQAVDPSAQMVLFARMLASISRIIGQPREAESYAAEADSLAARINALMWNPEKAFYVDLTLDGAQIPIKTIAGYWCLVAGVAPPERARSLAAHLRDTSSFGRLHPVPACPADEPGFDPRGNYWSGGVWAPTTLMVIRGLEAYGEDALARELALRHLDIVSDVFRRTGTLWENYAPDAAEPGRHADGTLVMKDFVGWSGLGPILLFLERGIGLKPDAPSNTLRWSIRAERSLGCDRYRFAGHVASLRAVPEPGVWRISIESDGAFTVQVDTGKEVRRVSVGKGRTLVTVAR
jgi:hypothetical protein